MKFDPQKEVYINRRMESFSVASVLKLKPLLLMLLKVFYDLGRMRFKIIASNEIFKTTPQSPTTHFFLKNFLHSSAISKHICANICVRCIDLQNIPKVKVCQILLISQNIELKTRHRCEVYYIDQRSVHKMYIDL